ncbi:hypothetical protein E8E11_001632 [Didymella keratinophila]|nr:hypothetical protein E8E11_001632 [Didymella keratinophila]
MTPMTIASPLREVAELKVEQFNQLKEDFKARYGIGSPPRVGNELHERIKTLIKNIEQFDTYLEDDDDLSIIARHVENLHDSSMSHEKLLSLEKQIMEKLHKQLSRYETTSLHLDLMKEVMESGKTDCSPTSSLNALSLEDDFELVEGGLEALWEKFEAESFTAKDVDVEALEEYLANLMKDNGYAADLEELRDDMRRYGEDILDGEIEIEEPELEWCIMDLLKNDLVAKDKKKTLEGYIQNQVAVKELLGVLNMKSIRQWKWKHTGKGLPVTARQDVEGQYHITVEEDLVDTLFLHCVAIGWAQKLKTCLSDYVRYMDRTKGRETSLADCREQEFFLQMMPYEPPPPPEPEPCPEKPGCTLLPPPPPPGMGFPPGFVVMPSSLKKKAKKKIPKAYPAPVFIAPPPPPPPPPPGRMSIYSSASDTLDNERLRVYKRDFLMSRLPTVDGCRPKIVPSEDVQAHLIKVLAAEIKLRAAFDGQPTCSVVDFHSLASALPHQTSLTALKFLGVPEAFIDFFARYLAADLNIGPSVRGTRDRVLTRACGVPDRHGLEILFTEAVMFFAELAVFKKTGLPMYRLGSRCYFVGTDKQNEVVAQELAGFSQHTKLEFDDVSVQPERLQIGLLELSGNAPVIMQSAVETYAHHVKSRLSASTTVFDWIRVWNSTAGTYAAHLFGPLVDLFGQDHLQSVKASYHEMFNIIFGSGSGLTSHVQDMLRARSEFARTSSPLALEAIIYLPQSFGGLGVKSPFVALNLDGKIDCDAEDMIKDYLDTETKYYDAALENWSALTPDNITKKHAAVFPDGNDDAIAASRDPDSDPTAFMTKEALTRHREYALFFHLPHRLLHDYNFCAPPPPPSYVHLPNLLGLYRALLNTSGEDVIVSERIKEEVRESGPCKRWEKLSREDQWVLMMYGDECLGRFGGLDVWFHTGALEDGTVSWEDDVARIGLDRIVPALSFGFAEFRWELISFRWYQSEQLEGVGEALQVRHPGSQVTKLLFLMRDLTFDAAPFGKGSDRQRWSARHFEVPDGCAAIKRRED